MLNQDIEVIDNILRYLIYQPQNKRELSTHFNINYKRLNKIMKTMEEKFLVKRIKISSDKFMITRQGIDLLLSKKVIILKYFYRCFYRLRIYNDVIQTMKEEYFTTKKKAQLRKEQIEHEAQLKITSQYFEIDEIQVK